MKKSQNRIYVSVFANTNEEEWHQWWWNFRNYYVDQGYNFDENADITRALKEWRAVDIPDTGDFWFENAQDHMVFMLRWQ